MPNVICERVTVKKRTLNRENFPMAISSTINKVSLNIANMDRNYYQIHDLTLAQHPSENDFRFMVRLIAFIMHASENLIFTKGLCDSDEPELWQKSLTDEIDLWIDLGQPDEKRIRKACGRSKQVMIYTYNDRKAKVWWAQQHEKLERFKNCRICHINAQGIEVLIKRTMTLQCSIQDNELYLSDDKNNVIITFEPLS